MSIAKLLEQQERLVEDMDKASRFDSPGTATLSLPVDLQERRRAALKLRVERLEKEKADYAARIDVAVKSLRSELEAFDRKVESDRKLIEPVLRSRGSKEATAREPAERAPSGKSKAAPKAAKAAPKPARGSRKR
ncbi:hypothetical protein [Sphingosinicella sp. CPCC 101087]|uniref:hypothetical protein n=1 Tax=Sphingosinicella sp. CPCC 101087 TaxID=2497754 RepID=UPI00101B7FA8|nr:hypothetical protein [Sphingosinicella sp. CPCC 101087]